jgi:hypothetical protein
VRTGLRDRLLEWSIRTEGAGPTPLAFDSLTGRNTTTPLLPRTEP